MRTQHPKRQKRLVASLSTIDCATQALLRKATTVTPRPPDRQIGRPTVPKPHLFLSSLYTPPHNVCCAKTSAVSFQLEGVLGWQNLVVQTNSEKCSDPDLARKCHLEIIFHDKYIGDFERVLGWQNLVVQTDTEKMTRML